LTASRDAAFCPIRLICACTDYRFYETTNHFYPENTIMTLKKTALVISLFYAMLSVNNVYAQEPTENEMLTALQSSISKKQAKWNEIRQSCAQRDESGDPGRAMLCLTVMLSDTGGDMTAVNISEFEKIACGKAEKAGYLCDYKVRVNAPGSAIGPMLQMVGAGVNTARFVSSNRGWMIIEN
jgi:hypothetical protein